MTREMLDNYREIRISNRILRLTFFYFPGLEDRMHALIFLTSTEYPASSFTRSLKKYRL